MGEQVQQFSQQDEGSHYSRSLSSCSRLRPGAKGRGVPTVSFRRNAPERRQECGSQEKEKGKRKRKETEGCWQRKRKEAEGSWQRKRKEAEGWWQKKKQNCSVTAAALCDDSTVNDTGADACATKFEEYITAFDDCLKTPTCDCFKALTPVESSCKFNDANTAAKALKDKCFKSDTPGSFGDCSGALKKASGKIGKCGLGVGTGAVGTTTKSARTLRRLAFHKF